MDQRAHDVEEDVKNILQTRLALADKIETLERQVEATVESTKAAALDALDLARNKAAGFIESTTHQLNPTVQAGRRPWIMVGSAMAIGFFAGLIEHRRRTSGVYPYYPAEADAADVMPEDGPSHERGPVYPFYGREEPRPSALASTFDDRSEGLRPQAGILDAWKPLRTLWDDLTGELLQERDRLQSAVLYAGRSFIQDIVRIAGQSLIDQLTRPAGSGVSRQGQRRISSD
ncbi:MAG TPA: hypothetical protein VJR03_08655 [Nitrospira sp.]|nr:hypothetical protein [Nitrospira sp.]